MILKLIRDLNVKENRLTLVKKSLVIFFLIGIVMSYNLWTNDRNFPLFPVFDNLVFSKLWGWAIFFAQLILLISVFFSNKKRLIFLIYVIFCFSLIQDQLRLQPWVYLYLLAFLPFLFITKDEDNYLGISYLQCLVIGVYIWSGIHKFNLNFIDIVVENISVNSFRVYDVSIINFIKSFGYVIPVFEILTGLFLWFSATRRIGILMAIFTHLFVLYYLGPYSMDSNYIVYPWNIEMIILVILLFYKTGDKISFGIERRFIKNVFRLALILVLGLPVFNFIGLWDHYLSFSFYSGKAPDLYILTKNPTELEHKYFLPIEGMEGGEIISVVNWASMELNVPFYPESRIFKSFIELYEKDVKGNDFVFIESSMPLYERQIYNTYGSKRKKKEVSKFFFLTFDNPIYLDTTSMKVLKQYSHLPD